MIGVKLRKKINGHLKKGTPGRITNNDFTSFGIGDAIETPWQVKVFFDNDEMFVLNSDLELDGNDGNKQTAKQPPQQIRLF